MTLFEGIRTLRERIPMAWPDAVDLMRSLKRTFDPENLLNPGKVVTL